MHVAQISSALLIQRNQQQRREPMELRHATVERIVTDPPRGPVGARPAPPAQFRRSCELPEGNRPANGLALSEGGFKVQDINDHAVHFWAIRSLRGCKQIPI